MQTIIILIPWFHPAYRAGGPVQSIANMVEYFSEDVSYKIICSNTDLGGEILEKSTDIWHAHNRGTKVLYASKKKSPVSFLKKEIKKENNHILFINGIYSWRFNLAPLLFCKTSKKIVSARGMLHPGALSQKKIKKKLYLFLWKIFRLHRKCYFHASNNEEKIYIENIFGKRTKIFVAQNFPRIFSKKTVPKKNTDSLQLISIALISPMKNYLLVLRALLKCTNYITYNIYGPVKDKGYWDLCFDEIKKLPPNIVVNYYGDIHPDKVEQALADSHVFILPSKSENFGHAIFEALTAGKPVITSNNTPWNNLKESKAGINITLESLEALSKAIDHFAEMNQNEFEQWSIGANKYSGRAINISDIQNQYKQMFLN